MKLIISFMLTTLAAFAIADSLGDKPETVDSVDIERYQGKWYEIVKIPNNFQKDCISDVTAEYSPAKKGRIKVLNSCLRESGEIEGEEGRARIEDRETNAKLKVTFVNFFGNWIFRFGGDYWVIELADDYSTVVVGHPEREYGWILSRTPSLSKETLTELAGRIEAQGYNPCDFISGIQADGLQEEASLCEIIK